MAVHLTQPVRCYAAPLYSLNSSSVYHLPTFFFQFGQFVLIVGG